MGFYSTNYVTTCKTGPFRENSGTILKGNPADNSIAINLSEIQNNSVQKNSGSILVFPTGVSSSGNLGIKKSISGRAALIQNANNWIGKTWSNMGVAGVASTFLQSGGGDVKNAMPVYKFFAYQRLNITSWNYATGAATKGGANGSSVLASGLNGVTGKNADHEYLPGGVPGEFTYIQAHSNPPYSDDYEIQTNP